MGMKKWQIAGFNKMLAKELAVECDIDPIVALIASARGYTDPASLEEFFVRRAMLRRPAEPRRYRKGRRYYRFIY